MIPNGEEAKFAIDYDSPGSQGPKSYKKSDYSSAASDAKLEKLTKEEDGGREVRYELNFTHLHHEVVEDTKEVKCERQWVIRDLFDSGVLHANMTGGES